MKTETTIKAGEFKTHCLRYLTEIDSYHTTFVITKRGKPIARLSPIADEAPRSLYGCLKGTVTVTGDIVSPLDEAWEADSGG